MRIKKYLLLISFFVFSFSLSQNLTQTIRGKVVNGLSKSELPGVQIIAFNDSGKVGGTQTDLNGFYRLQNIPIGRVIIKASFLGFQPADFKTEVTSAKEVILNFEMEESAL